MLQGTLDLLILKAVSLGPLHGYGVLLRIQQLSRQAFQIQQGSLYPALYRLEHQGLLGTEWGESENKRKAKYYQLTAAGKRRLPGRDTAMGQPGGRYGSCPEDHGGGDMNLAAHMRSFLQAVLNPSRLESDMDAEMRDHLDRYASDLVQQGLPLDEAQRRARVEFGVIGACKEECRDALGLRLWNDFQADLRYAVRILGQSPVFTAGAVLSLALGIGANTAIFSLVDTILLQSLSVSNPDALKILAWTSGPKVPMETIWGNCHGTTGRYCYPFSFPVFDELRRNSPHFSSLFAFKRLGATALIKGQAETVHLNLVSGEFFSGLGIQPSLGRGITGQDERQSESVVVLSNAFWRRRWGSDIHILGKHLTISDRALTIIGIAPSGFHGLHEGEEPDLFAPITYYVAGSDRSGGRDSSFYPPRRQFLVAGTGRPIEAGSDCIGCTGPSRFGAAAVRAGATRRQEGRWLASAIRAGSEGI